MHPLSNLLTTTPGQEFLANLAVVTVVGMGAHPPDQPGVLFFGGRESLVENWTTTAGYILFAPSSDALCY